MKLNSSFTNDAGNTEALIARPPPRSGPRTHPTSRLPARRPSPAQPSSATRCSSILRYHLRDVAWTPASALNGRFESSQGVHRRVSAILAALVGKPAFPQQALTCYKRTVAAGVTRLQVTVSASGYGGFAILKETLPAGFAFVESDLVADTVSVMGQTVIFTLLGAELVTAPADEGQYDFSGVLLDNLKQEAITAGDTSIRVGPEPTATLRPQPTATPEPTPAPTSAPTASPAPLVLYDRTHRPGAARVRPDRILVTQDPWRSRTAWFQGTAPSLNQF